MKFGEENDNCLLILLFNLTFCNNSQTFPDSPSTVTAMLKLTSILETCKRDLKKENHPNLIILFQRPQWHTVSVLLTLTLLHLNFICLDIYSPA